MCHAKPPRTHNIRPPPRYGGGYPPTDVLAKACVNVLHRAAVTRAVNDASVNTRIDVVKINGITGFTTYRLCVQPRASGRSNARARLTAPPLAAGSGR